MTTTMMSNSLNKMVSFILGASCAVALICFITSAKHGQKSPEWMDAAGEIQLVVSPHDDQDGRSNGTAKAGVPEKQDHELVHLLERAAMEDRTIIMTSVNEAWAAQDLLLDLFIESFRAGEKIKHLLNHLIIVSLDPKAFERCKAVHHYCYELKLAGIDVGKEKSYMSSDYLELVWSKVKLQQQILQLGYNFLFTDVDVMWFRNPFERMSVAAHISTSCDFYFGDAESPVNFPNTGFIYVKSMKKNVNLFKYWHETKDKFPGNHEQFVFQQIRFELVGRFESKIQFLDTANFGGFCNNTRDFNTLYTMHATCCVGLGAKLHDLRGLLADWKTYKEMPDEEKKRGPVLWRVPGICIH